MIRINKFFIKILIVPIVVLSVILLTQCTQPEGNIGKWFGSWYLEEMLINGSLDEEYASNKEEGKLQVLVSFQGNVFNMSYLNGAAIYGTWSYSGEILTLVASYNAGGGYDSPDFNPYPVVLRFPEGIEQMEITVSYLYSRSMRWQLIDQEGNLITYNFKKYP